MPTTTATTSRLVYTTHTGAPNHAAMVERIHRAALRPMRTGLACWITTPEPHEWGEFPMTCYACHMALDD